MTRQSPLAPIVLFVYKRLEHTRRTLAALAANELAAESELIVFSDAPKSITDQLKVDAVRSLIRDIKGFANVRVEKRETNFGLAASIIEGVKEVLDRHGQVIVLEDDLVTSPYFLRYMNDALRIYCDEAQVASIHAYCPPLKGVLPATFFLRGADCWGWATWKRAWKHFNADSRALLKELEARKLTRAFDFDGTYPYTQMLREHVAGKNDSWAIRWHAATFLREMLTLHPCKTHVQNIGLDGSGEHCGKTVAWEGQLANSLTEISKLPIQEDLLARAEFIRFFLQAKNSGLLDKFRRIFPIAKRLIDSFAASVKP